MKDKLSEVVSYVQGKAGQAADSVTAFVAREDTQAAVQWTKQTASTVADEAVELGRRAARSEMAKDAATGAAVGAVLAVPIPVIGPAIGAVVGASVGIARNLSPEGSKAATAGAPGADLHKMLSDLDDLRQKGIITDAEFDTQKKRILNRS
jgi:hypothetical protein